jgi:hypothetical protein
MGIDLILSLALKALPYLAVLGAALWAYIRIKSKGASEERVKWERRVEETQERVRTAQDADAEIDRRTADDIEKIKGTHDKKVDDSGHHQSADDDGIFRF